MIKKIKSFFFDHNYLVIFVVAMLVSIVFHAWNMFGFPYFENDEGTYFSQAYAVSNLGKVSYYTYWYDHVPMGWIIIALWLKITANPFIFGYSLFSARMFMLIVHFGSSMLLYLIAKKLNKNKYFPLIVVLLFSLSPLAVYFQRRLLLDNVMTLLILFAVYFVVYSRQKLTYFLFAGIFFALSVLTKETAIILLPAFWYLIFRYSYKVQRPFSLVLFTFPTIIGISFYALFALLKNELFPSDNQVSLIGTLNFQASRSGNSFWSPESDFYRSLMDWLKKDVIFTFMSFVSFLFLVINFFVKKFKLGFLIQFVALVCTILFLFFMRGGVMLNFYILPVIPFLCILITFVLFQLFQNPTQLKHVLLFLLTIWIVFASKSAWIVNETNPQIESVNWIKQNLDPSSIISIDATQLLDLRLSRFKNDPAFVNAHWFSKIENDPEIYNNLISGDWRKIDYVLSSHEYLTQIRIGAADFVKPTVYYSRPIIQWGPTQSSTFVQTEKYLSTNGDWNQVRQLLDPDEIILRDGYDNFKTHFVTDEGKVTDLSTNITTSEGQSYAMLQAVIMDEASDFSAIWNWTSSHLQWRKNDKLFSWKWGQNEDGKESIIDFAFATDADIDIATSLILAHKKWGEEKYLIAAKKITFDIWEQSVVEINGNYYLIAGPWANENGSYIVVNPSYASPAAYELFAKIDDNKDHDWLALKSDTYSFLNKFRYYSSSGLVSDWILVDKNNGQFLSATKIGFEEKFSYDAMRVYWRVAADWLWHSNREAKDFLDHTTFFTRTFDKNGKIVTAYSLSGEELTDIEDNAIYGGLYSSAIISNNISDDIAKRFEGNYDFEKKYWPERNNYYTQSWSWLGYALKANKFGPF